MEKTNLGYDMKDTLRWYASQMKGLSIGNIGMRKCPRIANPPLGQLNSDYIRNVLSLFPRNARERSILDKISWEKPLWFAKATLGTGIPTPTGMSYDAISPTAIIPGYTDYYLDKAGKLRASIELYQLETWIPPVVRQVVHTEALAHEFAHTIIAPALYGKQKLKLQNGEVVDGEEFLMDLGMRAEKRIPISHYAEAYRDFTASKDLPFKVISGDKKTAISEELAETIAEIVLPFVLHNPQQIPVREDHLKNRRDIVRGLEDFLNARRTK